MTVAPDEYGLTTWDYDTRIAQARADAYQSGSADVIEDLVRHLVALAIVTGVWKLGDGHGGQVLDWIHSAAETHGVEPPAPIIVQDFVYVGSRRIRALGERDGHVCAYCGVQLASDPKFPRPHVDHVIPKSRGGSNTMDNLVLACPHCNTSKGARTPEEWAAWRASKEGST